jgi:hypothetical protein
VNHVSPLPKQYFEWLYQQVFPDDGDSVLTYLTVCEIMHDMKFKIVVPRDGNRVADGAQLRNAFLRTVRAEPPDESELMFPDASIFEVLVALALKAERLIDISPHVMFGVFLNNLNLANLYDNSRTAGIRNDTFRRLRKFNERKYTSRGTGGLFPLMRSRIDQRNEELWYQMGAYMTENNMY